MIVVEETVTVGSEGLTIDLIVWRKFRRFMPGYVEQVLDRNIGLANLIDPLPVGTVITLPATELPAAAPVLEVVRLWD